MKLNEKLFYVINLIQDYRQYLITKNRLEEITQTGDEGKINHWAKTRELYFSLDTELLHSVGLNKNEFDFERVYMYRITDEMNNTEMKDLEKFKF
jgi:hypothetical protein